MNNLPLILAVCLSTPALAFAQQGPLPPGVPLPTKLVDFSTLELLGEGVSLEDYVLSGWKSFELGPLLRGDNDLNMEVARAERAEALAGLNGWNQTETAQWLRATAPQAVQISYVVRQGDQILASGSQPILPGHPITLGSSSMKSVVAELDVEIAQGASVADPYIKYLFEGTNLALDLLPVAGKGWWTELALTGSAGMDSKVIDTGYSQISGKDRVRQTYFELNASVMLVAGKANHLSLPGFKIGKNIELEIRVSEAPPSGVYAAGNYLCLDLPTLPVDDELASQISLHGGSLLWASPTGLMVLEKESGQMIAEELQRAAAEVSVVDLALSLASGKQQSGSPMLQLTSISNRPVHFSAGEAFDALVDWDVEVASTARVADPIFRRLYSGVTGTVSATISAGELVETQLQMQMTMSSIGQSTRLTLSGEMPLSQQDGGVLPATKVLCEHPLQAHSNFLWRGHLSQVEMRRSLPPLFDLGEQAIVRLSASMIDPN
jgi:hypothetical protein